MTKQSAVAPEAAVTPPGATVPSSSPVFPYQPVRAAAGLPIKKFQENQEISCGGRISSWVESMKASSPTHVQGPPPPAQEEHPSALGMFEEIVNLSKGKRIVMFLDYDGTLSPIVDDPDRAFMSKAMRAAVRDVAKLFPTAIVSGRCRDKGNKPALFQPASEFLPMIDEVSKLLAEKTRAIPGSRVENNRFCASVHFRCVDEKRWVELAMQVRSVLHDFPKLRLTHGRKVLEIRPIIEWDKGKALEFLLKSLGLADSNDVLPVYIGDDRTDEDAFKVLRERGQGFGILVSKVPKESHATYSLQEPSEVMDFLHRLVEWKRLSGQGHPIV